MVGITRSKVISLLAGRRPSKDWAGIMCVVFWSVVALFIWFFNVLAQGKTLPSSIGWEWLGPQQQAFSSVGVAQAQYKPLSNNYEWVAQSHVGPWVEKVVSFCPFSTRIAFRLRSFRQEAACFSRWFPTTLHCLSLVAKRGKLWPVRSSGNWHKHFSSKYCRSWKPISSPSMQHWVPAGDLEPFQDLWSAGRLLFWNGSHSVRSKGPGLAAEPLPSSWPSRVDAPGDVKKTRLVRLSTNFDSFMQLGYHKKTTSPCAIKLQYQALKAKYKYMRSSLLPLQNACHVNVEKTVNCQTNKTI